MPKVSQLEMEKLSWIIWVGSISSSEPLKAEHFFLAEDGEKQRKKRQERFKLQEGLDLLLLALTMKGP